MSYVAIWLQVCLHWRCAYFQTLSWNDTVVVVDWDILYKLGGPANKWSKGFVFSGKIWWQFFSCNKACSKYRTCSTTTPKYTLPQRLVALKSVNVARFNYRPKANLFCSKWRNSCVWRDSRVISPNQESVFTQLATLNLICYKACLICG